MSIDLDAIKTRDASEYGMECEDDRIGVLLQYALTDRNDLVAEVERLRGERADLQMLRDEHMMDNMHAYEEAERGERAAVVAYILAPGTSCDNARLAEAIERGEHRKETP